MEKNNFNRDIKRINYFFLISHGLPLFITVISMLLGKTFYIINPFFEKLIYFSLLSPTFAAVFVVYSYYSSQERKEYWLSIIDFTRISCKWFLIILLLPVLIRLTAVAIGAGLSISSFNLDFSPDITLPYALFLLFFGPIPEELGWRGIAFPELQKKYGFNIAALSLGFMWAIWHLPLFFVKGSYQYQLGFGSSLFWSFMLGMFFISTIYGLIYNKTNQSILAVILFHYVVNLTGETFVFTDHTEMISIIIQGALAFFILKYYGKKNEGS